MSTLKRVIVSMVEIARPFNFQWCKLFRIAVNRPFIPPSSAHDADPEVFHF